MGNESSTGLQNDDSDDDIRAKSMESTSPRPVVEFFSSAGKTIGQASGIVCGKLDDTFEDPDDVYNPKSFRGFSKKNMNSSFANPEDDASLQPNPMSHLFARALLNEVTDNPSTMTPAKMAEREKKLLKAQKRAFTSAREGTKVVGGQGTVRTQIERAGSRIIPPNLLSEQKAQFRGAKNSSSSGSGKYSVTIGLMMSMKDPSGNPNTVTRQRAFDFNMLQDREQKFVSSTDEHGWRAGGGEKGGKSSTTLNISNSNSDELESDSRVSSRPKIPTPDTVHIPIINIDCQSETAVNSVIASLARGEIFIPYMEVLPESLGVNGVSPPDLVVRFGCERDDELSPEDWPNWCLEFMHNQLYEYFEDAGATWMKRPFQLTLAKKVRWKTVKHMNQYFAKAETVINSWRERGPQLLEPELSHIDGGATPEEVSRPYGIYLLKNGKPTNYFAPNFEPPYTTKMTRSLLTNVISKSWDKKRRDWSNEPIPYVTPSLLLTSMCGCADPGAGGFVAREATNHFSPMGGATKFFDDKIGRGTILEEGIKIAREDSGIRRSQLGNVHSPNRVSESSGSINITSDGNLSGERSKSNTYFDRSRHTKTQSEAPNLKSQNSSPYTKPVVPVRNKDGQLFSQHNDLEQFSSDEYDLNIRDAHENSDQYEDNDDFISPQHTNFNADFETPIVTNSRGQSKVNEQSRNEGHYSTGMSVAESQTTVPIMNKSTSNKLIEQQRERRKERELERELERKKIDQLEMAILEKLKLQEEKKNREQGTSSKSLNISSDRNLFHDSIAETESPLESDDDLSKKKSSKKDKKAKKERKKREKKERKERERSRSIHRSREDNEEDTEWGFDPKISKTNPANYNAAIDEKSNDSFDEDIDLKKMKPRTQSFTMQQKEPVVRKNSLQPNPYLPIHLNGKVVNDQEVQSLASMDYSMDTASMMGDGSLIGAQFAGDSSVFTMGTSASDSKSLLSYVTRSTVHDMNGAEQSNQARSKQKPATMPVQQEEDDSILDSEEEEEIPSDEALFAIGWAKALDPNSGCYYYFTLDRTETVWENPLLHTEF